MGYYKLLITLFIWFGGTIFCHAQQTLSIQDIGEIYNLSTHITYLQDRTQKLTFKQILNPCYQQQFKANTQTVLHLGTTNTSVWVKMKVKLQTRENASYFLELTNAMMDVAIFYQKLPDGSYKKVQTGDHFDYNTRLIKNNNYLFKLALQPEETQTFYLHCQGKGVFFIDLRVGSSQALMETKHQEDLFMGVYVGIMLLAIIYNLFIYLFVRELAYIYYVTYIATVLLASIYGKGLALEFLWPNQVWLNDYSPTLITVNFLSACLFTNRFLSAKKYAPNWRKANFVVMGIFSCNLIINHTNYLLSLYVLQIGGSITGVLAICMATAVLRNGYQPARFYLLAWSVLILFFIVTAFKNMGIIPLKGSIINFALEFGSAIEALLLSVALADKLNYYRKAKQKATQLMLMAQQRNQKILENQNRLLEQKVKERTTEIIDQNHQLELQKEEIILQKEEISQQAENLKSANDQLISLSEFKELMTGMIVHDLKNPLNSIIGLSNGASHNQQLQFIHQSGRQMLHMVMNILDVQKFEETEVPMAIENHGLLEMIQDVINQIQLLADEKSIHLELNVAPDMFLKVDYDLISRVFINLLSNAIKYTPSGGKIVINSEATSTQQEFGKISIRDEGPGIASDQIAHIFSKFGQTNARKSGGVRSTGLGLTFCKMAVEAHQGTIGVDSALDQGSTFWLTLPIGQGVATTQETTNQTNSPQKDLFDFSSEESNLLKQIIPKIEHYEIYELSAIKTVLDQQSWDTYPNLVAWRQTLENALYDWNEERFKHLVELA
ncbi:MAG TPA: hypothetical protein DCS93_08040 [Microscillaceae bacterium]|nr:hypothetical protein [Microscillaceae bacterium]